MLLTKEKHIVFKDSWKLLAWGLVLIAAGLAILILQPSLIYRYSKMTFQQNGESSSLWMKPNVWSYARLHIFNITNAEAFLAGKEKLRLEEAGPYVYRMRLDYEEKSFDSEEGTMTVHPEYFFDWIPEMNSGSENDSLVIPNISLMLIASKVSDYSILLKKTLNGMMKTTPNDPIVTRKVKEFLRGGDNLILQVANTIFPYLVPVDSMGIFDRVSDSKGDFLTIYTGQKNFQKAGLIARYNNESKLSHLEAPCDRLEGASDGKKFGNNIAPNQTIYFYHKALCRTISLIPVGPPTVSKDSIPTVPYTFPDDMFDNGEANPENKCFCVDKKCLPSGTSDASKCYLGMPTAISLPHFFKGSSSLREKIDGLNPDKNRHDTRVYINQETGIATSASVKLQSNIVIHDVSEFDGCERFSNMIYPLLWAEVGYSELEKMIALKMFLALRICPIGEKILALLFVLAGIYCVLKMITKPKKTIKINAIKDVEVKLKNGNCNQYSDSCSLDSQSCSNRANKQAYQKSNILLDECIRLNCNK